METVMGRGWVSNSYRRENVMYTIEISVVPSEEGFKRLSRIILSMRMLDGRTFSFLEELTAIHQYQRRRVISR